MSVGFIDKISTKEKKTVVPVDDSIYRKRRKEGGANLKIYELTGRQGETQLNIDASSLIPEFGVSKDKDGVDQIMAKYGPNIKQKFNLSDKVEDLSLPPIIRYGRILGTVRISPLKLEHTYSNDGLVHNWINRIVEYFLSAEPKLVCDDDESQDKTDAWAKENGFREKLKITFQHKYIFGNAVLRWVNNKVGRPVNIDFIDPKFFDAVRDGQLKVTYGKDGNPVAYVQYLDTNVNYDHLGIDKRRFYRQTTMYTYLNGFGVLFMPSEIIHMRLNRLGDGWWGIGQIEPAYLDIVNQKNANQGFAEALQSIGYPRIIGYVGDENHPPTMQKADDLYEMLLDLKEQDIVVVPHYDEVKLLEATNINGVRDNLEYLKDNVVTGMGGPKSLVTGSGAETNRSTLSDQKMWLEMSLKMEQKDASDQIQTQLLDPLAKKLNLKSTPKLIWQEVSVESLDSKTDRLTAFMKAGAIPADDEKVQEYIRDLENLPAYSPKKQEKQEKETKEIELKSVEAKKAK